MKYHTIIIGAGSAGCVPASRLSENPNRPILLLEAGPDYPDPADMPPEIRSGFNPTFTHDWGYASVRAGTYELDAGCAVDPDP